MTNVAQKTDRSALPVVSRELARKLPQAVIGSGVIAGAIFAGLAWVFGHGQWWSAVISASVVALLAGVCSIVILRRLAGRTVDHAITLVMGASLARVGISVVGLLIAVIALGTSPRATAFMICGFYTATLVVESMLVVKATRTRTVGEAHA